MPEIDKKDIKTSFDIGDKVDYFNMETGEFDYKGEILAIHIYVWAKSSLEGMHWSYSVKYHIKPSYIRYFDWVEVNEAFIFYPSGCFDFNHFMDRMIEEHRIQKKCKDVAKAIRGESND